jgi:rhodanese-related sulfurtransferase
MKIAIALVVGVLFIFLGISLSPSATLDAEPQKQPGVSLIDGDEFINTFESIPDAILLDVRTPTEYNTGHIAGAINIDFNSPNFASEIQKLDPSKTYFLYCRSGNRSGQASQIMKQAGFESLYDIRGGVAATPQLLN